MGPYAGGLGAVMGASVALVGVVVTHQLSLRRELALNQWKLTAETYIDVIAWTGWVQHWFIMGSPDPHERPYTVTMARIAARLTAFGDKAAGDKAFELLTELTPYVSNKDISGHAPPPAHIRVLATELADLAQRRLAGPARRRP